MDELIFALLYGIAEVLAEMLVEVAFEAIVAVIVRSIRNFATRTSAVSPILSVFGYLLLGSGFGIVSAFLFPNALFHRSRFHGASLVISPVLTGLVMSQVGRILRQRGRNSVQIESFGYGFAFALGVATIRFFFVR